MDWRAASCAELDVDDFEIVSIVRESRTVEFYELTRTERRRLEDTARRLETLVVAGAAGCELIGDLKHGPWGWHCESGNKYVTCVHYDFGPVCDSGTIPDDRNPSGCGAN